MQFTHSPRPGSLLLWQEKGMRRPPPPVAHRLGGVQIGDKWTRDVILVALVGETNVTIAGGVYVGVMIADGEESGILLSGRWG